MSDLIDHLRSFNRKERYILLENALGAGTFSLDEDFRERLGRELRLDVPGEAFVAMDYHLDWLQVALYLSATPDPPRLIPQPEGFSATQIDVDLLVAFDESETTHVVLLEAKMETGWTNRQATEKAERLRVIFGESAGTGPVIPHFVLLSPNRPQQLQADDWPKWMTRDGQPVWMKLPRPPGLRKATRANEEGRASASGRLLHLDPPL